MKKKLEENIQRIKALRENTTNQLERDKLSKELQYVYLDYSNLLEQNDSESSRLDACGDQEYYDECGD